MAPYLISAVILGLVVLCWALARRAAFAPRPTFYDPPRDFYRPARWAVQAGLNDRVDIGSKPTTVTIPPGTYETSSDLDAALQAALAAAGVPGVTRVIEGPGEAPPYDPGPSDAPYDPGPSSYDGGGGDSGGGGASGDF